MDKRIYVTAGAAVVALPIIVLGIKKLLGQLWPGDESVPQHSSDPLEEEGIVAILHEKGTCFIITSFSIQFAPQNQFNLILKIYNYLIITKYNPLVIT
jgi:hypothetical protein